MRLYVLDENGHIVFEFENRDGDYDVRPTRILQLAVITLVRAALNHLTNYLIVHNGSE